MALATVTASFLEAYATLPQCSCSCINQSADGAAVLADRDAMSGAAHNSNWLALVSPGAGWSKALHLMNQMALSNMMHGPDWPALDAGLWFVKVEEETAWIHRCFSISLAICLNVCGLTLHPLYPSLNVARS